MSVNENTIYEIPRSGIMKVSIYIGIKAGCLIVMYHSRYERYTNFSKRVVYKTALLLYDGYGKRFPENIFRKA